MFLKSLAEETTFDIHLKNQFGLPTAAPRITPVTGNTAPRHRSPEVLNQDIL